MHDGLRGISMSIAFGARGVVASSDLPVSPHDLQSPFLHGANSTNVDNNMVFDVMCVRG